MITGTHALIHSDHAEEIRAFFRDILKFPSVDAGHAWLIFSLPPAEIGMHPAEKGSRYELYLMCDDINATLAELQAKGVTVAREVSDERWGRLAAIRLPDGSELPIYEPRHPSPPRRE